MQLLKITSVPIQYELQIKRAHLEYDLAETPTFDIRRTPADMKIDRNDIKVQIDTTDARHSLGYAGPKQMHQQGFDKGKQALLDTMADYARTGNQLAQIQTGVNIGQIVARKMLEQPELVTRFLPEPGAQISWNSPSIKMNYTPEKVEYDWNVMRNVLNYIPGEVRMNILQYPRVEIEYTGKPNYVPPSASPYYEERYV